VLPDEEESQSKRKPTLSRLMKKKIARNFLNKLQRDGSDPG
jgi:hypothetical protein